MYFASLTEFHKALDKCFTSIWMYYRINSFKDSPFWINKEDDGPWGSLGELLRSQLDTNRLLG